MRISADLAKPELVLKRRPKLLDVAIAVATVFAVSIFTAMGTLDIAFTLIIGGSLMLAALIKPHFALYVFAFSVPFESSILFTGPVGTVSKATALVLLASFAIHRWRDFQPSVFPAALWMWTAWALVSQFQVPADTGSQSISTLMQLVAMTFVVASMVRNEPSVGSRTAWAFVAGSSVVALVGIVAYLGQAPSSSVRTAAFANQSVAHFAAVMLPMLILGLGLLADRGVGEIPSRRMAPWFGTALVALAIAALLISGTRSAWVGAVAGSIVVLTLGVRGDRSTKLRSATIAVGAVVLLASIFATVPQIQELTIERVEQATVSGGSGRVNIWAVGLAIARDNLITGVGYGDFESSFTDEAIRYPLFESEIYKPIEEARAPHNIYLEILAELGFVGLVLWLAFLYGLLSKGGRHSMPTLAYAILVAYLTQGFFLDVLNRKYFWLFVALAIGYTSIRRRSTIPTTTARVVAPT